jgi:hypothetical protein
MAACSFETGMLFWKKPCAGAAMGSCHRCGRVVCGMHAGQRGDGSLLCVGCVEDNPGAMADFTSGSVLGTAAGAGLFTASAASPAAEQGAPESWHGPDSSDAGGSSDSGSSDSGGGDSGGSSSD